MYTIYIHEYKSFSTMHDKDLIQNIKKRRAGKIGKHNLNEMGALTMK